MLKYHQGAFIIGKPCLAITYLHVLIYLCNIRYSAISVYALNGLHCNRQIEQRLFKSLFKQYYRSGHREGAQQNSTPRPDKTCRLGRRGLVTCRVT